MAVRREKTAPQKKRLGRTEGSGDPHDPTMAQLIGDRVGPIFAQSA